MALSTTLQTLSSSLDSTPGILVHDLFHRRYMLRQPLLPIVDRQARQEADPQVEALITLTPESSYPAIGYFELKSDVSLDHAHLTHTWMCGAFSIFSGIYTSISIAYSKNHVMTLRWHFS